MKLKKMMKNDSPVMKVSLGLKDKNWMKNFSAMDRETRDHNISFTLGRKSFPASSSQPPNCQDTG